MIKKIILSTMLVSSLTTFAAEKKSTGPTTASIKADLEKCMNEDSSTIGMKMCLSEQGEVADSLLKKALSENKKAAEGDKEILKRINASQKAWEKFMAAQCDLEASDMLGGTGESLIFGSCVLNMSLDRVDSLNQRINSDK